MYKRQMQNLDIAEAACIVLAKFAENSYASDLVEHLSGIDLLDRRIRCLSFHIVRQTSKSGQILMHELH